MHARIYIKDADAAARIASFFSLRARSLAVIREPSLLFEAFADFFAFFGTSAFFGLGFFVEADAAEGAVEDDDEEDVPFASSFLRRFSLQTRQGFCDLTRCEQSKPQILQQLGEGAFDLFERQSGNAIDDRCRHILFKAFQLFHTIFHRALCLHPIHIRFLLLAMTSKHDNNT